MVRLARAGLLVCLLGVGDAQTFEGCSRGNGLCTCNPSNTRCNAIKPFFETAVDGCAGESMNNCGNNYGYKSCYLRPDQTCRTTPCWLWAVEVMAVCPEFFPDLSSSPLATCNASIVGTYDSSLVYEYEDRADGTAAGCSASHGECTSVCGKNFNALIDDEQCGEWIKAYASRAPVMKTDLDLFITRCDQRRTNSSSWWLLGLFISVLGFGMLTIAYCAYVQAKKGTDAQEQNPEGVTLDKIASKRRLDREATSTDMKADDEDDI